MLTTIIKSIKAVSLACVVLLVTSCSKPDVHPNGDYTPDSFAYKVLLAIDKEKIYPWEASENRITGTVLVSFDYVGDNGKAANIHVDKSSGNRYLDEAAIKAAANATLPPKPSELSGVTHFLVRISFLIGH